jgi:hypothetical protein
MGVIGLLNAESGVSGPTGRSNSPLTPDCRGLPPITPLARSKAAVEIDGPGAVLGHYHVALAIGQLYQAVRGGSDQRPPKWRGARPNECYYDRDKGVF